MGTQRKRVKSKGKRWIKGQSSNSNPSCKIHRHSATNNFFNEVPDGIYSFTLENIVRNFSAAIVLALCSMF